MKTPRHLAIIMDGNGRWSQKRGQPRVYGHIRGCRRVKPVIKEADRLGVKALTLFAFSTENWSRPEAELTVLWKLLRKYLIREVEELDRRNVRFRAIGEVERIPEDVRKVVEETEKRLAKNTGLQLTFAISYGSRRELARAARLFAEDCQAGKRQPSEMTEELLNTYLWTADMGELADVDMILRTSGERRVSNFLLWQAAYSELVFLDLCWPDFEPRHLREAIEEYCHRDRRFGGVSSAPARESESVSSFV